MPRAATVAASSWSACRPGTATKPLRASSTATGTMSGQLSDARLLVVTDLGLVTKRSVDGSHDVFVQSIATGAPVAGATVEIIGRNGLPVLSATTDDEGHVRFPDLRSFKNERAPVLYLARRGGDSSFLPFDGRDRTLDFSRFDVGGVESSADRAALAAYLFSDRGIYRPGEQIRAAAIVRNQDWSGDLDRLPLRLEVTDPRGIVVRRETYLAGRGRLRRDPARRRRKARRPARTRSRCRSCATSTTPI